MKLAKPLRLTVKRLDSYTAIKNREKSAEVRLLRGCITRLKKDDMVYLAHGKEEVKNYIDKLKIFGSIEEMLGNEIVKNAAGGSKRKLDSRFYEQFYRIDEMKRHNVAVIFFRLA